MLQSIQRHHHKTSVHPVPALVSHRKDHEGPRQRLQSQPVVVHPHPPKLLQVKACQIPLDQVKTTTPAIAKMANKANLKFTRGCEKSTLVKANLPKVSDTLFSFPFAAVLSMREKKKTFSEKKNFFFPYFLFYFSVLQFANCKIN